MAALEQLETESTPPRPDQGPEFFRRIAARYPILGDQRAWLATLLLLTGIVYSPCLGHDFILDQRTTIEFNPYLGDWSFLWKSFVHDDWWFRDPLHLPQSAYYRPIPNVWVSLNYHLFGLNPMGWHATGIALHLVVIWLVFQAATLLTRNKWTGLVTAMLFGLMPIHAEAVAWAFGMPLGAAFQLGAFAIYLRGRAGRACPASIAASLGLFA
ncbi:MAG TPA: hypothetical protein VMT58_04890, partial [Candidatus Binataceae bacterium]|nr:hypothetical protein [Candidatus Binataceae bacterium]